MRNHGYCKTEESIQAALCLTASHTYTLRKKAPYIAVLTDTSTASSGSEAVAEVFKGAVQKPEALAHPRMVFLQVT